MNEALAMPADELSAQAQFCHDAVTRWLEHPGITIACGRWADGAISEILPQGVAKLLPALYDGCFAGVRELRLAGQPHHLHIDFGRVHKLAYVVAPSVCLAFKPSFELRLLTLGAGGAPTDRWLVSFMLESPYVGGELDAAAALQFLRHAAQDAARRPDLVELSIDPEVRSAAAGAQVLAVLRRAAGMGDDADWDDAIRTLMQAPGPGPRPGQIDPPFLPLLREALALRDASLVIFRDRTLIEFKTERLDGVHRYEEAGHVSWQIGDQHEHHCHLALGGVTRVLFSAEPVSCQGGGLNYTLWFLTAGSCGNPYRRDGYFSIVLNRPYTGQQPRLDVIEPVLALYRRHRHLAWVEADATFMRVLELGPPPRHRTTDFDHAPA
jgi:hypothetical protein